MENNKTSLGRALKIANIVEQRNAIKNAINEKIQVPDKLGDPSIIYTGHIFPENMLWLTEEEKINVFKVHESQHCPKKYGIPSYVLVPSSDIFLTEEEMVESQKLHEKKLAITKEWEEFEDTITQIAQNVRRNIEKKTCADMINSLGDDKKNFISFLEDITGGNTDFVSELLNSVGITIDKSDDENENDSDEDSSPCDCCSGLDCDDDDDNGCCTGHCHKCSFKDECYKDDNDAENLCDTDAINDEPCDDDDDTLKPPYTI